MQDLTRTLESYDLAMLRVIANRWDIDLVVRDPRSAAARLSEAMHTPERVAAVWSRLDEPQRQAMQTILGSGGRMPTAMFKRLFGEVRTMGPDRLEREQPYLQPASLAEALYYRGLIANAFDSGATGVQPFTFVPSDLIPLLPTHKTGYDLSTTSPSSVSATPRAEPAQIRPADTILIDDLTTFLAFCQLNTVVPHDNGGLLSVSPEIQQALKPHLLGPASSARIALFLALSADLNLAIAQGEAWRPLPTARQWLEQRRTDQVRTLTEAWQRSTLYNELLYIPGLRPDVNAGWQNDPLLARQTVFSFLEIVPADQWWPVDELISEVKETEPDFQRPAGNYDSWYIRDTQTNQYLQGFESWDRVEGAHLRFILTGVMNGLGLIDTAEHGALCRLTTYGRALAGLCDWPTQGDDSPALAIKENGTLEVPRTVNRYDRFQLARCTEWVKAADPYVYRLSAVGFAQAGAQNMEPEALLVFLQYATHNAVPEPIVRLIQTWAQSGDQPALIEQLIVLRTPTPELLRTIQSTPELRRYLSIPLGPTAVAVRPDQWTDLAAALQAQGIRVESNFSDR